jgi:hypothetical protein
LWRLTCGPSIDDAPVSDQEFVDVLNDVSDSTSKPWRHWTTACVNSSLTTENQSVLALFVLIFDGHCLLMLPE